MNKVIALLLPAKSELLLLAGMIAALLGMLCGLRMCFAQMPMGGITVSAPAVSGPNPVGTPVCSATSYSTSPTISYTPHATGDTVFLSVWNGGGTATYSNVTNSQGQAATLVSSSATSSYAGIYEYASIASGVTNLSATASTNTYTTYCISEWSGVSGVGTTSQAQIMTTGSASPWAYTTSLNIGADDYVLAVATSLNSAAVTATATAGTLAGNQVLAYRSAFQQYNTSATAASVPISGTITGPSSTSTLYWTLLEVE